MVDSQVRKVFFDGGCSVCSKEIRWLRKKAHKKGLESQVQWVDIAASGFDPKEYGEEKTLEDFMKVFHVHDGTEMHQAMDAVRALYRFLGMGVWLNWSAYFPFRLFVDLCYHAFARFRPRGSSTSCKL